MNGALDTLPKLSAADMPAVTRDQMREVDRLMITAAPQGGQYGASPWVWALVRRDPRLARLRQRGAESATLLSPPVLIVRPTPAEWERGEELEEQQAN